MKEEGPAISSDLLLLDKSSGSWKILEVGEQAPSARFGHCSCTLPLLAMEGVLIFGGVDVDNDLGDLWLLTLT